MSVLLAFIDPYTLVKHRKMVWNGVMGPYWLYSVVYVGKLQIYSFTLFHTMVYSKKMYILQFTVYFYNGILWTMYPPICLCNSICHRDIRRELFLAYTSNGDHCHAVNRSLGVSAFYNIFLIEDLLFQWWDPQWSTIIYGGTKPQVFNTHAAPQG